MASDEIKVQITADSSGLESGAKQATSAVDSLNTKLESIKDSAATGSAGLKEAGDAAGSFADSLSRMGEIAGAVFGGFELQSLVDKFKNFASEAIFGSAELGEKLTNMSEATGISTDKLQELRFAAQITGSSFDTLQRSMSELSLKMLELQSGSKDQAMTGALAALGMKPADLADANTALDNLAAAVLRVGISEQSIGAVSELLGGRGGARLIPILMQVGELKQKFHELGLELSPGQVDALNKAAESTHLLAAEWEHFKDILGVQAAPALSAIADNLLPAIGKAAQDALPYIERLGPAMLPGGAGWAIPTLMGSPSSSNGVVQTPLQAGIPSPHTSYKTAPQLQPMQPASKAAQQTALTDFIESQRLMVAQSADTAAARIAEEQNIHGYIVSHEADLAAAGIDVNRQLMASAIGLANARKAAEREYASEYLRSEKEIGAALNASAQAHDQQRAAQFGDIGDAGLQAHLTQRWEEDQTKLADLTAQSKAAAAEIASVLTPIATAFDQVIGGILQGTQTATEAFRKMGESILLEFASGGLHALFTGGSQNSMWSALFGVSGKGGGIAGMAGSALTGGGAPGLSGAAGAGAGSAASGGILGWLLGPQVATSMMSGLKSMTNGPGGLLGWLFGTAVTAIFGGAKQAQGGAAPGGQPATGTATGTAATAGGSAIGSITGSLVSSLSSALKPIETPLVGMLEHLGSISASAVTQVAQAIIQTGYQEAIAAYNAVEVILDTYMSANSFKVLGTGAAGGIIPSAAGGMVAGGGLGFGGSLNILHPNEMVLPEPISRTIQNMTRDGSSGGGEIHTHFHVSAMDGKSVSDFFVRNSDAIARSIHKAVRNQNPAMHAAMRMGGPR